MVASCLVLACYTAHTGGGKQSGGPGGPPYSSGIGSSHKTDNNFQMIETATCAAMIGCQMLFVPTTARRVISPG